MQTEGLSDEELVARAKAGESKSYSALLRRHRQLLYGIACRILRNNADAEDALQEAYLRSYTRLGQFEGRSSVIAWLAKIAANQAFTFARRRTNWQSLDTTAAIGVRRLADTYAAPAGNPEEQAIRGQMETFLKTAFAALPLEFRRVLWLREVEGVNTQEAAVRHGVSKGCVKTRLFRAKNMLRTRLRSQVV